MHYQADHAPGFTHAVISSHCASSFIAPSLVTSGFYSAGAGAVPWQRQPPAQQAAGAVAAMQKALGTAAAELLVSRLAVAAAVDPAAEAAAPHSKLTTQQVRLICG